MLSRSSPCSTKRAVQGGFPTDRSSDSACAADKLHQHGRCSQVVLVTMDLPWPFSSREAVLDACGVDDIDAAGDICVLVESLDANARAATDPRSSSSWWTRLTPFASISKAGSCSARSRADGARRGARFPRRNRRRRRRGSRRVGDPPSRRMTRTRRRRRRGRHAVRRQRDAAPDVDGDDADTILVSVQMYIDPKISFVRPLMRRDWTVLYTMWCVLLRMAEGSGTEAPAHAAAIGRNARRCTIGRWRCEDMFRRVFGRGGGVAVVHHRLFQKGNYGVTCMCYFHSRGGKMEGRVGNGASLKRSADEVSGVSGVSVAPRAGSMRTRLDVVSRAIGWSNPRTEPSNSRTSMCVDGRLRALHPSRVTPHRPPRWSVRATAPTPKNIPLPLRCERARQPRYSTPIRPRSPFLPARDGR